MTFHPKVQILFILFMAMIVGVSMFSFIIILNSEGKFPGDLNSTTSQFFIYLLMFVLLIAFIFNRFVVQPKLQNVDPNSPLGEKMNNLTTNMIYYMAPWEALCLVSVFAINFTGALFPMITFTIGFLMMLLAFPTKMKIEKYGKFNAEEMKQIWPG